VPRYELTSCTRSGARAARTVALLLVCVLAVAAAAGCSGGSATGTRPQQTLSSQEMTAGQFPESRPSPAQAPPPPMLKRPESAVYSYILWISYAYRILNSDVATATFSPYEEVRVSSYVEYNREQGRALDQRLVGQKLKSVRSKGATSTVASLDSWKYRYIDINTGVYSSPVHDVSYDTTYTLVKGAKGWVVDSVAATPRGSAPQ